MKARVWIAFPALCLWAGSAWMYDVYFPAALTGLPRFTLDNGVLALGCLACAIWLREPLPASRIWWRLLAGGVVLFALPAILLAGASSQVTQSTETLIFLFVPVVVVFCAGQQSAGFGAAGGAMRGLVPALAGLGGGALILPFELPSSATGRVWLAGLTLSAIAAGIAAPAVHRLLGHVSLMQAGSTLFGVCFVLTARFSWLTRQALPPVTWPSLIAEAVRLVLIDAPILLLGLWLLRAMRPVAFTARILLIPAVTLLEGIVAERPNVGWYGWVGLALTVGAGVTLAAMRTEGD